MDGTHQEEYELHKSKRPFLINWLYCEQESRACANDHIHTQKYLTFTDENPWHVRFLKEAFHDDANRPQDQM